MHPSQKTTRLPAFVVCVASTALALLAGGGLRPQEKESKKPGPEKAQEGKKASKESEGKDKTDAKTPQQPGKPALLVAQRLSRSSTLSKEGGTKSTEDAVLKALDWLSRHQSADGGWGAADFVKRCKKPCKNKNPGRDGDGRGSSEKDMGVTALALLAFTGAGYSHTSAGKDAMTQVVQRAAAFLLSAQEHSGAAPGRIAGGGESWVYDHAIATLGLTELLLLSGDEATLKAPVTEAVRLCLKAQNPGKGWRYGIQPNENDSSVTGWMTLALVAASRAGLDIPVKDFERAFEGSNWLFARLTTPRKDGLHGAGR